MPGSTLRRTLRQTTDHDGKKRPRVPNKQKVATITKAQITEIAKTKMPDLNCPTLEAAESQVAGTCRSMGVTVVD